MTSIIGIKTNNGKPYIVLGADTQLNLYEGDRPVGRKVMYKIQPGKNWVFAYAGTVSDSLKEFFGWTMGQKSQVYVRGIESAIESAIKQKRFTEVDTLNALARKQGTEMEDLSSFILVTTKPFPLELWYVDEYGNLESAKEIIKNGDDNGLEYILMGSGEDAMSQFLKEEFDEESLAPQEDIDVQRGIDIVWDALYKAHRGGWQDTGAAPDIVIVSELSIDTYGKLFEKRIREAASGTKEEIKLKYKPQNV